MVPYFRKNLITLKKIVCGSHHNAALTSDNEMYSWGSNENGCLGHDIDEEFVSFTPNPGYCSFGKIINGVGIGRPQSIAIGKGYTIVCTDKYDGPPIEE
jgi:alpha-tubulin suppressor-like RCC1 family protein